MVTPSVVAVATFVIYPAFGLAVTLHIGGPADNTVLTRAQIGGHYKRTPGIGSQVWPPEPRRFPVLAAVARHFHFIQRDRAAEGHTVDHIASLLVGLQW